MSTFSIATIAESKQSAQFYLFYPYVFIGADVYNSASYDINLTIQINEAKNSYQNFFLLKAGELHHLRLPAPLSAQVSSQGSFISLQSKDLGKLLFDNVSYY